MMFIDGPSPAAPLDEWVQYLSRLSAFNPHDKTVRFEKDRANRIIKLHEEMDAKFLLVAHLSTAEQFYNERESQTIKKLKLEASAFSIKQDVMTLNGNESFSFTFKDGSILNIGFDDSVCFNNVKT